MRRLAAVLAVATSALLLQPDTSPAQSPLSLRGFTLASPIVWKPSPLYARDADWRVDTILLSRQSLRYYPNRTFSFGADLKQKVFAGESARDLRTSADVYSFRERYLDLEWTPVREDRISATLLLDRLWADAYLGQWQLRVGRQRIAWGTNLVWNPIDLFNPSSPLDFSNEEKPGTDAARLQWYMGPTSKLDLGFEPADEIERSAVALHLRTNWRDYDLHALAGHRREETVAGAAWAGNIAGGGFRGELLWVLPDSLRVFGESSLVAAVSGDYTFSNTTYLHAEVLYNSRGTTGKAGGLELLRSLRRGWLTPARWSLFGQAAKDLTPLLRGDVSGIVNPLDGSWYFGPSLSWSVVTNLDLTVMGLLFFGEDRTEFGNSGHLAMARLKWSF